jgi:hypothetical protein
MRRLSILSLIALTACSATGAKYSGDETTNFTAYRPSQFLYFSKDYPITINGQECDLSNGGFFTTDIKGTTLEASTWNFAGTSRIDVKPGDYVKVEFSDARMWGQGMSGLTGGAIGQAATEGGNRITSSDGPFILTKVPAAQAKQELVGLSRDCE